MVKAQVMPTPVFGADYPGDEGYIPWMGSATLHKPAPSLIANPSASNAEMLSGALHRLENVEDLISLFRERANDSGDHHLEACISTLGRLCGEVGAICNALIDRAKDSLGGAPHIEITKSSKCACGKVGVSK